MSVYFFNVKFPRWLRLLVWIGVAAVLSFGLFLTYSNMRNATERTFPNHGHDIYPHTHRR